MFCHNTLRYYYFDIIMIIDSERRESSEGIRDNISFTLQYYDVVSSTVMTTLA